MRFRQNLKALFRNVSVEEYATLSMASDERRLWNMEDRASFPVPPAADSSLIGAILWSSFVLWQDNPGFVAFALFCGSSCIILRVIDVLKFGGL